VGFLLEPDFCRIWKKCQIPAGAGAEIQYSPNFNSVQLNSQEVSLGQHILCAQVLWPMACIVIVVMLSHGAAVGLTYCVVSNNKPKSHDL